MGGGEGTRKEYMGKVQRREGDKRGNVTKERRDHEKKDEKGNNGLRDRIGEKSWNRDERGRKGTGN